MFSQRQPKSRRSSTRLSSAARLGLLALSSFLPAPSARAAPDRIGINFFTLETGGTVSNHWLAPTVSAGATTSVCHTTKIYQGATYIGGN